MKDINKLLMMPTIAMCEWEQFNPSNPEMGKVVHRNQVIKITKHSVIMRSIDGCAIITLSSTPGWDVFNFVKIDKTLSDTNAYSKMDETMKKWLNDR